MEEEKITRSNPKGMPEPVGNYTHITKIPRNAEWYVASGQVGMDEDGSFPESMNRQISNTFKNIKAVLAAEELEAGHIVKVNIWATDKIDWDWMNAKWHVLFGDEFPAMTIGYLAALGLPEIKVEIEIWAAKP
jgi:enamine deaminase RidA (YjgF/YER057c/UK114 family)